MRLVEKKKWNEIQSMVKNMQGQRPQSEHCVKNAVKRVSAAGKKGVIKTQYKNCGRKKALTPEDTKRVLEFVKTWKTKLFAHAPALRGSLT